MQPHLQTVKLLSEGLAIEVEDLIILKHPNEEVIKKKMDAFIARFAIFRFDYSIWECVVSSVFVD